VSIKLGVYDFFSYTLPGTIYLFIIIYLFSDRNLDYIKFLFDNSNFTLLLIFGLFAYLLGIMMHPLCLMIWNRLFMRANLKEQALKNFRSSYGYEDFFEGRHNSVCIARIRLNNVESADRIDKHSANRIMLINLSFGLALASIIVLSEIILNGYSNHKIALLIAFGVLSALSLRQAKIFGVWYFSLLFETWAAFCEEHQIDPNRTENEDEETQGAGS